MFFSQYGKDQQDLRLFGCWHHSDLQLVPISLWIDKDLEKTTFSRVAFLAYLLTLSEITIRERRADKTVSHPIQRPEPWKAALFSSAPNPCPWPREGEKTGLEEKGQWFFGGCPAAGEPYLAEPRPHPFVTRAWLNKRLGLYPPCPCSGHHREPPYREKPQESYWFPALGKVAPGEASCGNFVCASSMLKWKYLAGRCPRRRGTVGALAAAHAACGRALALGLSPRPWQDTALGGQLQNLKIKVCHLAVGFGLLGTTTQIPTVFRWSGYDFWNIYSVFC